jgi:hypothetical protein
MEQVARVVYGDEFTLAYLIKSARSEPAERMLSLMGLEFQNAEPARPTNVPCYAVSIFLLRALCFQGTAGMPTSIYLALFALLNRNFHIRRSTELYWFLEKKVHIIVVQIFETKTLFFA